MRGEGSGRPVQNRALYDLIGALCILHQEKLDRINELARKARSEEGLTPAEMVERDLLRQEYVAAYRDNLIAQLENTIIVEPDGTRHKLGKKP